MMRTVTIALAACCGIFAQSFEVASIKQHILPVRMVGMDLSGARLTATAMTLTNLIIYRARLEAVSSFGRAKMGH
jgi:hypothetical protein